MAKATRFTKKRLQQIIVELSQLSDDQLETYSSLLHREMRRRGYATIVWTPEELKNANPSRVEDASVGVGWEIIKDLQ